MAKPVVAIIGRPNVGKSTLLNRLAGRRVAIVADLPGTTRDRIFADVSWHGTDFTLVDTGGLEVSPSSSVSKVVKEQVEAAIAEADVIIFLTDVKDGVVTSDLEISDMLRSVSKPMLLIANKADNNKLEEQAVEFFELGLGEPLALSAHHGRGTAELLDKVVSLLPAPVPVKAAKGAMRLAIVGRPNVGKSTLLNTLLGSKRVIVDDKPGTTRDAINTPLDFDGQNVILIDTAGIRRRSRWGKGIERYSVIRALKAIDEADVVLLVVDATEMLTAQDTHIAGYIQQAAKGVILVINKWDLAGSEAKTEFESNIKRQLKFMAYAPVEYISATSGQGVDRLLPEAFQIYEERHKRLPTNEVNSVVQAAVASHNLPRAGTKRLKVLYATQAEVNPPTFVFFVNDTKLVHFSYQRYLGNKLRQAFGFDGTPFRLIFKNRGEQ